MLPEKAWEIILENKGIIGSIIKKNFSFFISFFCIEIEDLYSIGEIGMYKALIGLEIKDTNGTFYGLTQRYIKSEIITHLRNFYFRTVRVPICQHKKRQYIPKKMLEFSKGVEDLAKKTILGDRNPVELDNIYGDDSDEPLIERFMSCENGILEELSSKEAYKILSHLISNLSEKEKDILIQTTGLFGFEIKKQSDIGKMYGVKGNAIGESKKRIINKIRRLLYP
jgi:RNA polymerase sigma factor (sigma-70 family)